VQPDPVVRRVAYGAAVICLASAAVALAWRGGGAAVSVLGGGLLIGVSFYTLGGGVAAIVAAISDGSPSRWIMLGTLARLVLRYALLGFLAYVMIARLRLHPIGLLVGASSVPAAAFVEAVRLLAKKKS
jgi:hypothetical protein